MLKLSMAGRSGGRSWFGLALGFCLFAAGVSGGSGVAATAEDDLNAQHLVMIDDELVGDPREIPLIVETGSLRLEVVLEAAEGVRMILYNPSGLEAKLDEPNIAVTRVAGRHSVLLWDPRPGPWKVRLEGRGSYRLRVTTQGDLFVCCAQIFTRNQIFAFERSRLVIGSEQQVQIFASGYTIDSIDVGMVDQRGNQIAPVPFRQNDPSNISGFTILLAVPSQPFRLKVEGRDLAGKPFRRIIPPLCIPVKGTEADENDRQAANPRTIEELRQTVTRGPHRIIRTHIVHWSDEPLITPSGNQIGIRLRFRATFPTEAVYSPYPILHPDRIDQGYTGALNLRLQRATVTPSPIGMNGSAWTPGSQVRFGAGIEYDFVVDLVPTYTATTSGTAADGKLCLNYRAFSQPETRHRFEKEISSRKRMRFRFNVAGSDLEGKATALTEQTYIPDIWWQGLQREGVTECKF
ncbi:MAG: hypothetical protein RIR52_1083 [Acidobacteriota bacterium]